MLTKKQIKKRYKKRMRKYGASKATAKSAWKTFAPLIDRELRRGHSPEVAIVKAADQLRRNATARATLTKWSNPDRMAEQAKAHRVAHFKKLAERWDQSDRELAEGYRQLAKEAAEE